MIPVRQFNQFDTVEVMQAHAKACRERIRNAKARPAPPPKFVILPKRALPRTIYDFPAGPIFIREAVRDYLRVSSEDAEVKAKDTGLRIIAEVCLKYGISKQEIIGHRRTLTLVEAKREMCFRLRRETGLSFPRIGMLLGGKDHSTVHYNFYKYLDMNPEVVRDSERVSLAHWRESNARNFARNSGYWAKCRQERQSKRRAVAL